MCFEHEHRTYSFQPNRVWISQKVVGQVHSGSLEFNIQVVVSGAQTKV
jgi:hypothetical protein